MKILILYLFIVMGYCANANILNDTLYINADTTTVAAYNLHFRSFNSTPIFNVQNSTLHQTDQDTLSITIINNDSLIHDFTIDNYITNGNIINPGDTATVTFHLNQNGTFRYYSSLAYGHLLGASGIISVGNDQLKHFYWNLFDQQDSLSSSIANGTQTNIFSQYVPEIFCINNLIYPNTTLDSSAYVDISINDSVIIHILNSGKMDHVFHFHGYHVTILDALFNSNQVGWNKDTFPIKVNEGISVLLVPDKPGIFPVHDHNLITVVTGAYPGGMIAVLNVSP